MLKINLLLIKIAYLLFSRNAKKTYTDQSILQFFYSLRKEKTCKPSKIAAAKSFSPSVCIIDITCFEECFLFHVITGRHCFF